MNKFYLFLLFILDFLLILFVSSVIGYGFYLLDKPLVPSILFSFSIIFILGLLNNFHLKSKNERVNKQIEYETNKLKSKIAMNINCAYCRAENIQYVQLDKEMFFDCMSCKQPNKIVINYGAIRITTPLNTDINLKDVLPEE